MDPGSLISKNSMVFLCATEAFQATPKQLKKALLFIWEDFPITSLDSFSQAIRKAQLRLLRLDPVALKYKSRQTKRPLTAPLKSSRKNKHKSSKNSVEEVEAALRQESQRDLMRLDLSDSISKRNVAQKRQEPSLIGRWERRAQPYLGKFTKPAMAFAFVYKEKDTIDKDRKRSDYLAQSSVDAANQKDSMESKRGKSAKATNVFIAQTLSARLKKKSLALQDEKRIFSYLEQWMDSKYLRIRDAFKRIDTDGSGELDINEFQDLCTSMGLTLSRSELQWIFERIDTDKSGEISFQEFDDHIRIQRKKLAMLRNDKRIGGEKGDRTTYAKMENSYTGVSIDFTPPLVGSYRY